MPLWHRKARISCYMDVSQYSRLLFGKTSSCCGLGWPKHLGKVFAGVGSIFPEGHAYGHGEFIHSLAPWHIALCTHLEWWIPTSVAEILTKRLCLSPTWGTYDIGCQGGAYYPSGEGGVAEWFVVVGWQGWQGMPRAFQKLCPMSSTHWGYSSSWTGRRARGSSMFCMWREEMSGYYALVWPLSTGWHMACLWPPLTFLPSGQWRSPCCRGSLVLGIFTNRTQWSCVVFITLCMFKWRINSSGLGTQSNIT